MVYRHTVPGCRTAVSRSTHRPRARRLRTTAISAAVLASISWTALPTMTAGAAPVSRPAPPASTCATPTKSYGRMFANLPGASFDTSALDALAAATMAPDEAAPSTGPDPEENRAIPAGYTYFGQFLDHDITSDDRSTVLSGTVDPTTLTNGRTPQLDLDSVYGNGPSSSPSLYAPDGVHLLEGTALSGSPDIGVRDLPRAANGMAVIGDLRNDENRMVAAIHASFLRLHNRIVDRIQAANPTLSGTEVLARARRELTQGYQQVVLTDFLPTVAGRGALDAVLVGGPNGMTPRLRFYSPCQNMPVEFSAAAYRYGHSQVRASYRTNATTSPLPVFSGTFQPGSDLAGFSPAPAGSAVDWNLFLAPTSTTPQRLRPAAGTGRELLQWSYKLDTSLTASLGRLPLPTTDLGAATLARRNLLRGRQLGLPSGQDVARALGVAPLRDDQILIGAATGEPGATKAITAVDASFAGKAPLWTYVLAEAVAGAYPVRDGRIIGPQRAPMRLGPVGGRIVAETLVGLVASDPASVLRAPVRGGAPAPRSLRELVDRAAGER